MSGNSEYKIRKLDRSEHTRTRALWESVFIEDTEAFLDYYYDEKVKNNVIYAAEKDGQLCAMLHLNPYWIMAGDEKVQSYYIVAVATLPGHRHKGLMRGLLEKSMVDMEKESVPFTFLMPAAEAIYYPFGFRFFYKQTQKDLNFQNHSEENLEIWEADPSMCKEMAKFAGEILKLNYRVYAQRTEEYYQTMLKEQKSQNGGIYCVKDGGELRGVFCYTKENKLEFREPLYGPGGEEILKYLIPKGETVRVIGTQNEEKDGRPMIMGRIVNLERFLNLLGVKEDFSARIWFRDSFIEENEGMYVLEGRKGRLYAKKLRDAERKPVEMLGVETFFSVVTGYLCVEEIDEKDITEKGEEVLSKISVFGPSFLNEVV